MLDAAEAASSLCNDPAMLDEWHVVAYTREVAPGALFPIRLLGRDLVAWRDEAGVAHVWEDICIHRGARLSKGWIAENTVSAPIMAGATTGRRNAC